MGVGIPGTGMNGLPIAIALGAIRGKSADCLELLKDLTPDEVESGKSYINEKRINVRLKEDVSDKLFIEVHCSRGNNYAKAIISGNHTAFSYLEKNGEVLLDKKTDGPEVSDIAVQLSFRKLYDYATESPPITELNFILDAAEMNKRAAEISGKRHFGHNVSKKILREQKGKKFLGGIICTVEW